jgi:predicted SprT family Zn-dependent metalloprotease
MRRKPWQLVFSWLPQPATAVKKRLAAQMPDEVLTIWCRETAAALGLPELARRVEVSWNNRMQTTAGRAWWPARLIELNPKIENIDPEQKWRTLRHELAHLIAYERAGRRKIEAHGADWRQACADLGIPGESVFHQLPLKRRKIQPKYIYGCPNCRSQFKRVKKISKPMACYPCCKKYSNGKYDERFRLREVKGEKSI